MIPMTIKQRFRVYFRKSQQTGSGWNLTAKLGLFGFRFCVGYMNGLGTIENGFVFFNLARKVYLGEDILAHPFMHSIKNVPNMVS